MKKINRLVAAMGIPLLLTNYIYAQTTSTASTTPTATTTSGTTTPTTTITTTTGATGNTTTSVTSNGVTTTTGSGTGSGSGIQQTAGGASTMQVAGMIAGGVAAGVAGTQMVHFCTAGGVTGLTSSACGLWTLGTAASLGVAIMMGVEASKSSSTKSGVTDGNGAGTGGGTSGINGPSATQLYSDVVAPAVRAAQQNYPNVAINPDGTATLPNGTHVNPMNPASVAAALSPAEQAQYKAIQDQIAAQTKAQLAATDGTNVLAAEDGGAGGRTAASTTTTADAGAGAKGKAMGGPGTGANKGQIGAGLVRNLDGTPIGSSADDLFGMVHNRYSFENSHNSAFIGSPPASPVAATSLPPGL